MYLQGVILTFSHRPETDSLRFRDHVEFIKVFFYGAISTADIITAVSQLMKAA